MTTHTEDQGRRPDQRRGSYIGAFLSIAAFIILIAALLIMKLLNLGIYGTV